MTFPVTNFSSISFSFSQDPGSMEDHGKVREAYFIQRNLNNKNRNFIHHGKYKVDCPNGVVKVKSGANDIA